MSHLQTLDKAQYECETGAGCEKYDSLIQQRYDEIDASTANAVEITMISGFIALLVGLYFLATPAVPLIRKIHEFVFPKLLIIFPVLVGIIAGAFIGFMISFSACFKQECNAFESSAMLTIPLIGIALTFPLARLVFRRRLRLKTFVGSLKPEFWYVFGGLVIAAACSLTALQIQNEKERGERQKGYVQEDLNRSRIY